MGKAKMSMNTRLHSISCRLGSLQNSVFGLVRHQIRGRKDTDLEVARLVETSRTSHAMAGLLGLAAESALSVSSAVYRSHRFPPAARAGRHVGISALMQKERGEDSP